jgi:Icc protein
MSAAPPLRPFQARLPDAARILSWIHIGDLHMTRAGEQNDLDLNAIVGEINHTFAGSLSFLYLPGDVADDGGASAYTVVGRALDRLTIPWCSIIGPNKNGRKW